MQPTRSTGVNIRGRESNGRAGGVTSVFNQVPSTEVPAIPAALLKVASQCLSVGADRVENNVERGRKIAVFLRRSGERAP